jgi:hypothetical protein
VVKRLFVTVPGVSSLRTAGLRRLRLPIVGAMAVAAAATAGCGEKSEPAVHAPTTAAPATTAPVTTAPAPTQTKPPRATRKQKQRP